MSRTQRLWNRNARENKLIIFLNARNKLWSPIPGYHTEKNGFVTATKLGTTNESFVVSTKNFAAATKRFADSTIHFVVVTKYFCYPYFNKWLCWFNKTFFPCIFHKLLMNVSIFLATHVIEGKTEILSREWEICCSVLSMLQLWRLFSRQKLVVNWQCAWRPSCCTANCRLRKQILFN